MLIQTGRWYNINNQRVYVMDVVNDNIHGFLYKGSMKLDEVVIPANSIKSVWRSRRPSILVCNPRCNKYAQIVVQTV